MSRLRKLLLMEEHTCPWWFGYTFDNPIRGFLHDPADVLCGLVKEGDTVADVGCGGGHFSLGLAKIVGEQGRVIALDVQQRMLQRARSRAKRQGLDRVIDFRLCKPDGLGLDESLDFVLAFWMAHEVPDKRAFFSEIRSALKPSGRLFVAEPKVHVSAARFEKTVEIARESGFETVSQPRVRFSRASTFS
ncbi:class I SAM-dependent methyltransferase, partial [Gemmatimonadota bacterium]